MDVSSSVKKRLIKKKNKEVSELDEDSYSKPPINAEGEVSAYRNVNGTLSSNT